MLILEKMLAACTQKWKKKMTYIFKILNKNIREQHHLLCYENFDSVVMRHDARSVIYDTFRSLYKPHHFYYPYPHKRMVLHHLAIRTCCNRILHEVSGNRLRRWSFYHSSTAIEYSWGNSQRIIPLLISKMRS